MKKTFKIIFIVEICLFVGLNSFCLSDKAVTSKPPKKTLLYQHDIIIPGLPPPKQYYEIKGGSCGEAVLSSIYKASGLCISQKQINKSGGAPGRGLYTHELFKSLKYYKIPHKKIPGKVKNYNDFIKTNLIANINKNIPVLLGVKVYPDQHPNWACDHFILIVGYNKKTRELIYNSDDNRPIY